MSDQPHSSFERATVSAVVALMFLLQAMAVGFATAAANGAPLGPVCGAAQVETGKSDPSRADWRHVGPCCILHCSAAVDDLDARIPVAISPPQMFSERPTAIYTIDAAIVAPELRPLSPRAPPAPNA